MLVLCCPTYKCYDKCVDMILSAFRGTKKPDYVAIMDNGGGFADYLRAVNEKGYFAEIQGAAVEVVTPGENLGVARSWNKFIKSMTEDDTLLIVNDDILFEHTTIEDLLTGMARNPHDGLIYVSDSSGINAFSMFLFTNKAKAEVGYFDEHFYPAYFEDNDYARRMLLKGYELTRIPCSVRHSGSSTLSKYSAEEMKEHHERFRQNENYYKRKWGGPPHHETYMHPFNDPSYTDETER